MENRIIYGAAALAVLVLAGGFFLQNTVSSPAPEEGPESGTDTVSSWQTVELTDVRTGETFTVKSFARPVLVESFAVWCPTCTRQQEEIKKLHKKVGDDIVSVSIDTDPNEKASKVRNHIQRHGFDWRYAVAPPEMIQDLIDSYGSSVVNAPLAPMILVCPDGTAERLPNGVKPADSLIQTVQDRCQGV